MKTISYDETKWKLVPKEVSPEQIARISQFDMIHSKRPHQAEYARDLYNAFIQSAPTPPADDTVEISDYIAAEIAQGKMTKEQFTSARQWVQAMYYGQAQQDADKVEAQPYVWTPGPDEFKDWCASWFGQDSDESYLAKAVFNLPPMAQKFNCTEARPDPAMAGDLEKTLKILSDDYREATTRVQRMDAFNQLFDYVRKL